MVSMVAKIMAAIHSIRSCPYWCSLSDSLLAYLTPAITTMVLSTSDAEWKPSEIIAAEFAIKPAKSLPTDNKRLPMILLMETIIAVRSS